MSAAPVLASVVQARSGAQPLNDSARPMGPSRQSIGLYKR